MTAKNFGITQLERLVILNKVLTVCGSTLERFQQSTARMPYKLAS
jgi:hypothetical protein